MRARPQRLWHEARHGHRPDGPEGAPMNAWNDNAPIPLVAGLGALAGRYDALLVDLWGCLHNGVAA